VAEVHGSERCHALSQSVEECLKALWTEVLGVKDVDADAHFVELGGQSLQAVLLLSRIHEVTGVEVPFKLFAQMPTVNAVAAHLQSNGIAAVKATRNTLEESGLL
jgi:acyl carrier protein